MFLEYFEKMPKEDDRFSFVERKVLALDDHEWEINWISIFRIFCNPVIVPIAKLYLDWEASQEAAYIVKQYCQYQGIRCDVIIGEKPVMAPIPKTDI